MRRLLSRDARLGRRRLDDSVFKHPSLDLIAIDVGQHLAVDLDAGREGLAAFLHHLSVNIWIVDNIFVFVCQAVFGERWCARYCSSGKPASDRRRYGDFRP